MVLISDLVKATSIQGTHRFEVSLEVLGLLVQPTDVLQALAGLLLQPG